MTDFGDFVRTQREKQGLSLRAFARLVNVTPSYMLDIERGNRKPNNEVLLAGMVKALCLLGSEAYKLYDTAAKQRHEAPQDIMVYVREHKDVRDMLRERMRTNHE